MLLPQFGQKTQNARGTSIIPKCFPNLMLTKKSECSGMGESASIAASTLDASIPSLSESILL